jgi:hypothetical protein
MEGEIYLIKNNMSGDDNLVGEEIKTPVAFMISGVIEENTYVGPGCQFMSGLGGEIEIAGTIDHLAE